MHISDAGTRLSATDLAHFLSCRHLTALDLGVTRKARSKPRPEKEDPRLERTRPRGIAREAAHVRGVLPPHPGMSWTASRRGTKR
jgi:hypothetical protein